VLVPDAQPDGATVLCVALYAQCFLVHGITQPADASRQAHFRAVDDLGARYLARGGGAGGVPGETTAFTYVFSGGVPAEASRLTITLVGAARSTWTCAETTSPERRAAEVLLSELYLLLLARPDVAGRMVTNRLELTVTACARAGLSPPDEEEIWRGRAKRLTAPRRRPPSPV
jgi:hypothetical protein